MPVQQPRDGGGGGAKIRPPDGLGASYPHDPLVDEVGVRLEQLMELAALLLHLEERPIHIVVDRNAERRGELALLEQRATHRQAKLLQLLTGGERLGRPCQHQLDRGFDVLQLVAHRVEVAHLVDEPPDDRLALGLPLPQYPRVRQLLPLPVQVAADGLGQPDTFHPGSRPLESPAPHLDIRVDRFDPGRLVEDLRAASRERSIRVED
jgi:hypothetical protein